MSMTLFHNGTVLSGFSMMRNCDVLVEDNKVADVFGEKRYAQRSFGPETKIIDVEGAFIAPGFIDTHIHGFGGRGTDETGADPILAMSDMLSRWGVTAFCPTLYPAPRKELLEIVTEASGAMGRESGARIMGLHLEGPFISPERLGVQRPETLSPVDLEFMDELWRASGGRIVNMTVAPELKHMRDLALYCVKKGIVLQAGHTNASYENMKEGMQAGILHATHLFNAMSGLHHRNPNAVGAVLIHPEMSCEIIPDGHHVHPDLVRLLVRDKPMDHIVLVTDSIRPTEQETGRLFANGEEVELKDGVFHRKADDVIAGSALTMIQGVRNLSEYGISVPDAVMTATANPARVMRFLRKGVLIPGMDADITVFDSGFEVKAVMAEGRLLRDDIS